MAKKEYIEREASLEFLCSTYDIPLESWMARNYWAKVVEIKQKFISCIEEIPAADVVEVVRCKDCKHSVKYNCKNDACYSFTICRRRDGYAEDVIEDDFCSYGERKEQK